MAAHLPLKLRAGATPLLSLPARSGLTSELRARHMPTRPLPHEFQGGASPLALGSEVCLPLAVGGGPAQPPSLVHPSGPPAWVGVTGTWSCQEAGMQGSSPPCPSCCRVGPLTHRRFTRHPVCAETGQATCSSVTQQRPGPRPQRPRVRPVFRARPPWSPPKVRQGTVGSLAGGVPAEPAVLHASRVAPASGFL